MQKEATLSKKVLSARTKPTKTSRLTSLKLPETFRLQKKQVPIVKNQQKNTCNR